LSVVKRNVLREEAMRLSDKIRPPFNQENKCAAKYLTRLKTENRTYFYDNPVTFVTYLSPTGYHHITKIH